MENQMVIKDSPADMIRIAVTNGADLDQLEKLLALQEKWEANEARKAYHKAMAEFKNNPPKITKNKKVGYTTSKGLVSYTHATLANVVEQITQELSKHGLSASWVTKQNGNISVTCKITHALGHSEETTLSANADDTGSKNSIQALGSTITYLERYTILAATGLATHDQDNDANIKNEIKINDEQLSTILDNLNNLPEPEKKKVKFLDYMEVERCEDILAINYKKALEALKSATQRQK